MHKKKIIKLISVILSMLLVVLTVGCSKRTGSVEYEGYYFFYTDAALSGVYHSEYKPKEKDTTELIKEFIAKMGEVPDDASGRQLIPEGVSVEDFNLDEDGNLSLYFNSAYANTSGVPETLMRAAIVKNLMQIPDINGVQFYVAGQPLVDSKAEPIGLLTSDDFIDNTAGEIMYTQRVSITLFFADKSGNTLKRCAVDINYDASMTVEQTIVEQLMKGPNSINGIESDELLPTIPEGTKVNKITVKDKTCYIDFSKEFMDKNDNITGYVALYSVVNTLTELSNIDKVQFSIDGEQTLTYNESINFGSVFERNLDLVSG
jgi:germination protein M